MLWDWDGTLERIHHALYVAVRDREGREASPSAAVIDSQSAKGAQKGGASLDPQGFDAGKKVTGRKRHILVDTLGLLLSVIVHPADVQDRDGARELLRTAPFVPLHRDHLRRRRLPGAEDGGDRRHDRLLEAGIVKRTDAHRFVALPKRWIVERTFAWISRNRRLARDFERYARTVVAFVRLAMIRIMLRRLTPPTPCR